MLDFSADGLAGGAVVDDFNNDGLLDIVTSSINGKLQLFYRQKDGGFKDASTESGLENFWGGLNITHVDFNNDGWLIFLLQEGLGWQKLAKYPIHY